MTTRRVLITDAHATAALAVVRSLGEAGVRVSVVGEEDHFNLATYSRYVDRHFIWPSAERQPAAYLRCLQDELTHTSYDVLLPISDTTVTLVREKRAELAPLVRIGLPPNDSLDTVLDKAATVRLAEHAGVAVPKTVVFHSLAEAIEHAPRLSYPRVVKSRSSRTWAGTGPLRRSLLRYVHSSDALIDLFREIGEPPGSFLVQEVVKGTGVGVFVLADGGQPLRIFAHRRLREANPTGGRASLAESIEPDPRLIDPALRLIEALAWTGVAMVEFKDPGAPHEPVLMEVNGRFWGSLPLARAAGVDFPILLVRALVGETLPPVKPYRVGVRCRYLKGDLSYLSAALKGRPKDWRGPYPGRLEALGAVLPWPGRWHSYNFSFGDPVPGLREAGDFLRKEAARVPRGLRAQLHRMTP